MNFRKSLFDIRRWLYRHYPVRKRSIVFISHLGKTYACNPRYICEYISEKYPDEFDLYWIYDKTIGKPDSLPKNVIAVPYFSYKFLKLLSSAHLIISNTRISNAFYFEKRKGQKYIQTWHSSMRLKCIEKDANLGSSYESFAREDSLKIDYIISGSRFSTGIFKNSFWYDGKIIETGTPRIDWLKNITDYQKEQIYKKANLQSSTHYLLYAPTFRKGGDTDAYNIEYSSLIQVLEKKFGGKWRVLFRMHPNLKGNIDCKSQDERVLDVTDYDDIQELLTISDILITDYSSSMFDAAIINKPCFLYASDLDKYLKNERNLYFEIKDLPFPLAQTNEELKSNISAFEMNEFTVHNQKFLHSLGVCENGDACQKIFRLIESLVNE